MVYHEYYENDEDDEPTVYDSNGAECGYCFHCQQLSVLTDLSWDGLCPDCVEN
jgi:hypothetical protein